MWRGVRRLVPLWLTEKEAEMEVKRIPGNALMTTEVRNTRMCLLYVSLWAINWAKRGEIDQLTWTTTDLKFKCLHTRPN